MHRIQDAETSSLRQKLGERLRSRVLLDTWPYPLDPSSDIFNNVTGKCDIPSLFLESENFMHGKEVELTKEIARNGGKWPDLGILREACMHNSATFPCGILLGLEG